MDKETKELSPTEYAKAKGCNRSHVGNYIRRIKRGESLALPGVRNIRRVGNQYVLEVVIDEINQK